MRRLTRAPNAAIAQLWADLLCQAGYPTTVERRFLSSVAGELPPDQCLPELWLRHDEHDAAARQLLDELARLPQHQWQCPSCGEQIEGGFEQCWACGAWMPR
ncbi:DUF2007 domain-containing protein [Ottowia sp. SB7-C50]|jgi:hypothetical protein|uniref:DUF2007 domain-containing protein n=1 Tax=Ottowia sp. SB7-C50 TaxID=3081231 RepID=UPI00295510B0|nr:DUF2007 domain-containing protein [Ottowia sp. SB7-C50]WOP15611.1 DUF2007 domain-containing protein [Ottowia sp. SB7-C50]